MCCGGDEGAGHVVEGGEGVLFGGGGDAFAAFGAAEERSGPAESSCSVVLGQAGGGAQVGQQAGGVVDVDEVGQGDAEQGGEFLPGLWCG